MIKVEIPGKGEYHLEHVVFDVNGTLAVDGQLLPGVPELLGTLNNTLDIHLLTADTHGKQAEIDQLLKVKSERVKPGDEAGQKAAYIQKLGADSTVAVGQGANDAEMLRSAVIGICILSPEGAAVKTLLGADLIVPDIHSAINLLLHPIRLKASLRS